MTNYFFITTSNSFCFTGVKRKNISEDDTDNILLVQPEPEQSKVRKIESEIVNPITEISDTKITNVASQNELLSKVDSELFKGDSELFKTLSGDPDLLNEYRTQPDTKAYRYFEQSNEYFKGSEDDSRSYIYGTSDRAANKRRCGKKYFSDIYFIVHSNLEITNLDIVNFPI